MTMQLMPLVIFWAIVTAFIVCGCILTRKPTKKPLGETLRPVVLLSKTKGALIGRAAGEPYKSDISGCAPGGGGYHQ